MIIGINGKIGSGKDTVGSIIQYLTSECGDSNSSRHRTYAEFLEKGGGSNLRNFDQHYVSDWEIKKFAGKLKQTASLLTGIPVEKFEDQEFKKLDMNPEWKMTYREFLQKLGTEAMRDNLHENVWVNALFADYKPTQMVSSFPPPATEEEYISQQGYPKWIITDMRFPNELESVVLRNGITIRVSRPFVHKCTTFVAEDLRVKFKDKGLNITKEDLNKETIDELEKFSKQNEHPSETALDNAEFDYEIINDGTIEELVEKVITILTLEKII